MRFHECHIDLAQRSGLLEGAKSKLHFWNHSDLNLGADASYFGYVYKGSAQISAMGRQFSIDEGYSFVFPGPLLVTGPCAGFCAGAQGYAAIATITGPLELGGRVGYIDGCEDTLLIAPLVKGNPCLNFLHMPPKVNQTMHTHPSDRLGLVVRGSGVCRLKQSEVALRPGVAFLLESEEEHSFHTSADILDIVVYHPDSDFGPDSVNNPMLNRTIVSGISAKMLPDIQTGTVSHGSQPAGA
jgi:hypothetical protein